MRKLLAVALLAPSLLAQANAVPGLDITMYEVTDLGFYGRRGPAYPNGEAGFMVGHSWCNSGTVNLPWVSQSGGVMVDNYPRIAFLLVRESGGRMVQISAAGHSKHSPVPFNFQTGPCLPCNPTGGAFFFVGCSDTYGSGTNASQYALGPDIELNPWLGTWNPQGSYFDRGDPPVAGPQAIDSIRSLTSTQVAAFDSVKNRMVVRETELVTTGATYYGQIQAVIKGEPVAERDNNVMHRQVSISGTGGNWNTGTAGPSQFGSVLTRWQGASTDAGSNGTDDGRFVVAVKVTGPVGGMWHYEYAIHNIDNHRGGASFRVPLAPGAVVQNAGFRDIDNDPLNDWTFTQNATEAVFSAVGTNALNWNTIYNCWFDCSITPGAGNASIDQARPGPGALTVQVPSEVPSGLAFASKHPVGSACGACTSAFYEYFSTLTAFDLAGRSMTMSLNGGTYSVVETPVAFVPVAGTNLGLGFNSQATVTLPFSLPYPGGATTQLRVCSSGYVSPVVPPAIQVVPTVSAFLNGFARWAAMWHGLGTLTMGSANVFFDANATRAIVTWNAAPSLAGAGTSTFQIQFFPDGTVHVLWQNVASSSLSALVGWTPGGGMLDPGPRDLAATLTTPFGLCATAFNGLALDASDEPVLGTTVQWQLSGIPAGTGWGALMRSLTEATPPIDLSAFGMPGCSAYVAAPVASLFLSPGSSVQVPESIPSGTSLIGVTLVGQAVTYSPPLTPLGLVASNGMVLMLGL